MQPLVQPFFHADSNTWSYLVHAPGDTAAAIIDPVLDFDPKAARTSTTSAQAIVDAVQAQGLRVEWILETHAHADHLSAGHWLKHTHWPKARLAIGEGIRTVQKTFRPIFNLGEHFPIDGSQFDHLFTDGETFEIGALEARVIPVPGHTSDSNAYLIGDALFTGDSLFMPDGGTARCDFPGGDARQLYQSIQRLLALPTDTRLFMCHDYPPEGRDVAWSTTVGEQRASNIHVNDSIDLEGFVTMRTTRDATLSVPQLLIPAIQINIRAGNLPPADDSGLCSLKVPLNRF